MAVPSVMADLSTTAATNSPAGTESPSNADDFLRAIQAIVRTTNAKGSDIASAATTDIGAATAEFVDVTGTTTITALGTIAAGIVRTVRFTGALTLTHNATSLQLPGSANITTANGDMAQFRSLGSGNWKCVSYIKQDGTPIALGSVTVTPEKLSNDAFISILGNSKNLIITNNSGTPNSQVDIDADEIILKDSNKRAYLASSVNLTANIASSGADGLDTGSEASGTWYYLWVIYNGTTVASLISASSTAPTLPSGYTYKALVGAIYNDGSSNFIKIRQVANKVAYEANRTIVDGAVTTLAWTSISVAAFFPPTAKSVQIAGAEQFGISHRSDGMGGSYFLSGNAATPRTFSVFPTARNAFNTGECLYASSIYYFIVATPGTLLATGWEY